MQTWEEFKRVEDIALKKKLDAEQESVRCKICGSTWFTEREFFQFKSEHNLVVGQNVPHRFPNSVGFILLECVHCKGLLEPRIMSSTKDLAANLYNNFLDTVEGKNDIRVIEKKEETK